MPVSDSVWVFSCVMYASLVSTKRLISPKEKFLFSVSNTMMPPRSSFPANKDNLRTRSLEVITPSNSDCSFTTGNKESSLSATSLSADKKYSSPFTEICCSEDSSEASKPVSSASSKSSLLMIPANFSSLNTGRCNTSYSSIKLSANDILSNKLTAGKPELINCDASMCSFLNIRHKPGQGCSLLFQPG